MWLPVLALCSCTDERRWSRPVGAGLFCGTSPGDVLPAILWGKDVMVSVVVAAR